MRTTLLVVAALIVAVAVESWVFFIRPETGVVGRPDAVVVLGGYEHGARIERGISVARQEHVRTLALSTAGHESCPTGAAGPDIGVVCFQPDPLTTQGEARWIAAAARARHWSDIVVVSGTTQVSRARVRVGRCYHGQAGYVGVDPAGTFQWLHLLTYDETAMMKALVFQRSC